MDNPLLTPGQKALLALIEHRTANPQPFHAPVRPSHLLILAMHKLGFEASGAQCECAARDPRGMDTDLRLSVVRVDGEVFDAQGRRGTDAIAKGWLDGWTSAGYKMRSPVEWHDYAYDIAVHDPSRSSLTHADLHEMSFQLAKAAMAEVQSAQLHEQTPQPSHQRPARRVL